MAKKAYIPLSVPNITGNEIKYVTKTLEDGWVSTAGACITEFENKMAEYLGVKAACACQSGTAGLHLCLRALGVGEGDIVLVPTLTFIAPINAVIYQNASPLFFDCSDNFSIDVVQIQEYLETQCDFDGETVREKASGRVVKAVIPVHVFGDLCDMDALVALCGKYELFLIEDATESLGTRIESGNFAGRYAGTVGRIGVLSFNGNKIITTGGGGMVVSDDDTLINRIRYLSTQAKDDTFYFVHNDVGYNYRMTNMQAAMGLAQLERLEEFIAVKKENYFLYRELLSQSKIGCMAEFSGGIRPNYWFCSFVLHNPDFEKRDKLMAFLEENGVQTRPIWKLNHTQIPFRGYKATDTPLAEQYYDSVINIPCSSNLAQDDVRRVCRLILEFEEQ